MFDDDDDLLFYAFHSSAGLGIHRKIYSFFAGITYSHEHTSKYHQTLVKRDPPKVLKSKAWMPQHF